ncbi:CDP-alcohol phosphatidyltransferase family protein [Pseudonocardia xishanensis]|uniref:CDP-alcohol phosphatidyltransferase family protein n=1 Tax=Pseudonocardia xishanensis TaxID=630995 RepID=A0ABP8RZN0_9PSEU
MGADAERPGPSTGTGAERGPAGGSARTDEEGWARLHGGVRPPAPARVWIAGVQRLAAGPVGRVPPDLLSLAGVVAVGAAVPTAGRLPLLAALLVLVGGVLDGLDGAVALRTGRARPLGAVVDATADRLGDLLLPAVLAALGAPPRWCVAVGAAVLLHEYVRARAQAVGMPGVGAVTVAERPTRVVVVLVAALGSGLMPAGTPFTGWSWATACLLIWAVLALVGLGQLGVSVVRTVPREFGPRR